MAGLFWYTTEAAIVDVHHVVLLIAFLVMAPLALGPLILRSHDNCEIDGVRP
jgi:hypothetical protein